MFSTISVDILRSQHEFLNLANPGGAWSLKRHYFETLPIGIRIGGHKDVSISK